MMEYKLKLAVFFVVCSCTLSFSQRLCEIGDYDFILQTIKGVDTTSYTKVVLIDSLGNTLFKYKYDKKNRIQEVNFTGEGLYYNRLESSSCYMRNSLSYTYKKLKDTLCIEVLNDTIVEKILMSYNAKKHPSTIKSDWVHIDFGYKNNKIYTIQKNNYQYKYLWDKNLLSKLIIDSKGYTPTREFNFSYNNQGEISKVVRQIVKMGKRETLTTFYYQYKNQKLVKVILKNRDGKFYYNFDYNHTEKMKITKTDEAGDCLLQLLYYY